MPTERRSAIDAATMPASISTSAPTDLHPHSLLPMADVLVDSEMVDSPAASYQSARTALKAMYESHVAIDDAHTACLTNIKIGTEKSSGRPILQRGLDPQRAPALAAAMSESFSRTAAQVAASEEILGRTATQLENDVATSLINKKANETGTATCAADIRRYVAHLKDPGARMNFLQEAVEDGDLETVSAVLQSNNPFISGLTRVEAARLRDLAAEKFAPRSYKQLKAITAVRAHLDRAQRSYVASYYSKLPRAAANAADSALIKLKG